MILHLASSFVLLVRSEVVSIGVVVVDPKGVVRNGAKVVARKNGLLFLTCLFVCLSVCFDEDFFFFRRIFFNGFSSKFRPLLLKPR